MRVSGKQNGMVNSVVRWVSRTHVDTVLEEGRERVL